MLALSTAATLALHRAWFGQALLAVEEARLDLAAADTAARLQAGLDLGLELGAMADAPAIIAGALRDDAGVVSGAVVERGGGVLFAAGDATAARAAARASPSPPPPPDATPRDDGPEPVPADGVPRGPSRSVELGPELIVARAGLTDMFGRDAGAVVLAYARPRVDGMVAALTWRLVGAGALLLAAAGALARLLAGLVLGRTSRELALAAERLEAAAAGEVSGAAPGVASSGGGATPLGRELAAAEAVLGRVLPPPPSPPSPPHGAGA